LENEFIRIQQVFVIEERNASYHTYTKIYPATIKTFLRRANKEFSVTQMDQITASDIRVLLAERIDHYHKDKEFSESYNIFSILSALKAFQKRCDDIWIYMRTEMLLISKLLANG